MRSFFISFFLLLGLLIPQNAQAQTQLPHCKGIPHTNTAPEKKQLKDFYACQAQGTSCTECAKEVKYDRAATCCLCHGNNPAEYSCCEKGYAVIPFKIKNRDGGSACVKPDNTACDVWRLEYGVCTRPWVSLGLLQAEKGTLELTPELYCGLLQGVVKGKNCVGLPIGSKEKPPITWVDCPLTDLLPGKCPIGS